MNATTESLLVIFAISVSLYIIGEPALYLIAMNSSPQSVIVKVQPEIENSFGVQENIGQSNKLQEQSQIVQVQSQLSTKSGSVVSPAYHGKTP